MMMINQRQRAEAYYYYYQQSDLATLYRSSILAYTPVAFYDVSISSIWQNSTRTTPATANGDVVGGMDDLSGNGYHVTQVTTSVKPSLQLNVLNGYPVIRFDGGDDLNNAAFPDFGDTYTAFCIAKYATAGSADASQALFDVSTAATNTGFLMFHDTASKATARDASALRTVTGSDLRNDSWKLHSMTNSASLLSYWQNAVSIGTPAAYTAPNPNTLTTLSIGHLTNNGAFFLIGDIATIIIFNTQLSTQDRQAIEAILNARYAIY